MTLSAGIGRRMPVNGAQRLPVFLSFAFAAEEEDDDDKDDEGTGMVCRMLEMRDDDEEADDAEPTGDMGGDLGDIGVENPLPPGLTILLLTPLPLPLPPLLPLFLLRRCACLRARSLSFCRRLSSRRFFSSSAAAAAALSFSISSADNLCPSAT